MTTYTLLGIDRFVNTRTSKRRFKPQTGLTDQQLNKIRDREKSQLIRQHPDRIRTTLIFCYFTKKKPTKNQSK